MEKGKEQPCILFVTFEDFSGIGVGVSKKVLGQVDALRNLGFYVLLIHCNEGKFVLCDGNDVKTLCSYGRSRTNYSLLLSFVLRKTLKQRRIDFIYARGSVNFLLYQLINQNASVIVELPSLESEKRIWANKKLGFFRRLVLLLRFEIARILPFRHIDYFINYEGFSRLFGRPAFSMNNCINVSNIPIKSDKSQRTSDNFINLIAVASMYYWQGYERIIESLGKYKRRLGTGARKVRLILVGDGTEIPYYRSLVKEYNLQEDVEFCGILRGEELDRVFDQADVALSGLGLYKQGMYSTSTLKNKEYCARGLPVVDASNDLAFTGKEDFVLQIPNDSSDIDMEKILEFYDRVSSIPGIRQRIRAFCKENFDWTREFQRFFKTAFNLDLDSAPSVIQNITL